MSIQRSLNQALGIGAVLYTQTPGYDAKKEEKLKQTRIKGLESELAGYQESLKGLDMKEWQADRVKTSLEAGEESIRRDLIKLDPSVSRLLEYYQEMEIRRQEANYQAQGIIANRQEQMTGFAQHMANWGKGKRPKVGETNGK